MNRKQVMPIQINAQQIAALINIIRCEWLESISFPNSLLNSKLRTLSWRRAGSEYLCRYPWSSVGRFDTTRNVLSRLLTFLNTPPHFAAILSIIRSITPLQETGNLFRK